MALPTVKRPLRHTDPAEEAALLDAIDHFEKSGEPLWQAGVDFSTIRATTRRLAHGEDWRPAT